MFATFTTLSVLTKKDPSLHFSSKFPKIYYVFKIAAIALIGLLGAGFLLHSFYILRQWHQVINRNKFFYLFSTYFIVFLLITVLSSPFQSYDDDGLKLLFVLIMYNFYIMTLQSMWRITPKGFDEAKNIFDIKRPGVMDLKYPGADNELDYFKDSIKVEVVSESERKTDESFETYRDSEDEAQSVQSVPLTRSRRSAGTVGRSSRLSSKTRNR